MTCPDRKRLDAFLEGLLSPGEAAEADRHAAGCADCRAALESRRRMIEAAASLPDIEVPPGFSSLVMARIATASDPERAGPFRWAGALAAGSAVILIPLLLAGILTGGRFLAFAPKAAAALSFWIGDAAGTAARTAKALFHGIEALVHLAAGLVDALRVLASLIGPQTQIVLAALAVFILIAGVACFRRRFPYTEHHHES